MGPPWWPQGEPYPSGERAAAWPGMRRRFLRRIGFVFLFVFLLMLAVSAIAVTLLSGALGLGDRPGLAVPAALLALALLIVGGAAVIRLVRRAAGPVADVMEAADRVAGGDYEVRVSERGPRELRGLARSFNAMAERLNAAEDQRRNLLADVAHELRTPLSVIQGTAEGLADGVYGPERLQPLLEEADVMSRLLEDLQTLSTAEAGALRLHREPVGPSALVEDALAAARATADAHSVRLEADVEPDLPDLEVDPVRVGEVLGNLLSNAIRHSPEGAEVTVSTDRADGGLGVSFSVKDSGSGIGPETLPHVFDRFVKGGESGGAGLGLAIARTLVEAHGGRITAESSPGAGTTLRFVLPTGGDSPPA